MDRRKVLVPWIDLATRDADLQGRRGGVGKERWIEARFPCRGDEESTRERERRRLKRSDTGWRETTEICKMALRDAFFRDDVVLPAGQCTVAYEPVNYTSVLR
jgi:hypothetical protein